MTRTGLVSRVRRALQLRRDQWSAVHAARARTAERLRDPMRRVLVVCYGNIYRSPFVAMRLQALVPDLAIRSAGFHPREGRESPAGHVAMARGYDVDLASHRSRLVTGGDLEWADAIVLMDRNNWSCLRQAGADPRKMVWLGTLGPGPVEIPDPYGKPVGDAEEIVRRMFSLTARLAEQISARKDS